MPIPPRFQRFLNGFPERNKIVERSAALIVVAADCSFRLVAMAMPQRIVALAVKLCVFGIGKSSSAQTVCCIKCHSHPKKDGSVLPHLGEKIRTLVQAYTIQRSHRARPSKNVTAQTLRCDGTIGQIRDVFIEIAVIEFLLQIEQASTDRIVANQRQFLAAEWFRRSVRKSNTIIMPVNRSGRPEQTRIFLSA